MAAKTYEEEESRHLYRVLESASDLAHAELDRDFARKVGGVRKLRRELRLTVFSAQRFIDENQPDGP